MQMNNSLKRNVPLIIVGDSVLENISARTANTNIPYEMPSAIISR